MLDPVSTINCKGRLLDLSTPIVMGILNVTPDSFFDGGHFQQLDAALFRAEEMLNEGASIIDIGGMSSRPGAELIGEEEELGRVIPVIEVLAEAFPEAVFSVDTVRALVARKAVEAGASLVNDISAGRFDDKLYQEVADLGVPYVLMHMQGNPGTMQQAPVYEDVVREVLDFFIAETGKLRALGVKDILLDPGFGFGKTVEHNYALLRDLHQFRLLDLPVLAGLSRKSMINKVLHISPSEALNGTTALNMAALLHGASVLRVHDVLPAVETIRLWKELTGSGVEKG